jgi:restriction system protein
MDKKLAPSRILASKTIYMAFKILKMNDNEMSIKELLNEMERKINFNDWEKGRFEKSGQLRWQSVFHFFSIDCVKTGYLVKNNGIWYLTPEGIEAESMGEEALFENINKGYKKWKKETITADDDLSDEKETEEEIDDKEDLLIYAELQEKAIEGMINYINKKNPYEFQDLVAALLRGMGYFTPFVAPKGKDGGVDIIAYKDPLGTTAPRIQVQIKHRENTATSVKEIRELMGLLKNGDVGIFVSSGGFTSDAKSTARTSNNHIELIDQNRFIELWQDFYYKLSDKDKYLFPLKPLYFLNIKENLL